MSRDRAELCRETRHCRGHSTAVWFPWRAPRNIGPAELIVILLVALLVVGPKRLPEVGRSIGKALREFRRTTEEVRSSFEASLDEEPSPNREVTSALSGEPDDPDEMPIHDVHSQESTSPERSEDTGTPPAANHG